jgi:hypothetical protein
MKVGDLVKNTNTYHHFGVGLVIKKLPSLPWEQGVGLKTKTRWAILWTSPLWTSEGGWSVTYETELEVIHESR